MACEDDSTIVGDGDSGGVQEDGAAGVTELAEGEE
jgi:hypothetical protein